MRANVPSLTVLGVPVAALDVDSAIAEVHTLLRTPEPAMLAYVNAHTLNLAHRDRAFRAVLHGADLVLNDGSGLSLAARMQGARFPANLNGTDFTPRLLASAAAAQAPVFLLGGKPGVAKASAARLIERVPGLNIVGHAHGYTDAPGRAGLVERIRESGAHVLVVGMGNPLQEKWLAEHLPATGVRLGVAVGAFLDFAAEVVPRAPQWMRTAGVEWMYRLGQEPTRLWRRYVLGNPAFVLRVLRERISNR
jgi:exopolysaccharide biosynthesis WecB/TagA/CpsF family protein